MTGRTTIERSKTFEAVHGIKVFECYHVPAEDGFGVVLEAVRLARAVREERQKLVVTPCGPGAHCTAREGMDFTVIHSVAHDTVEVVEEP